MDPFQIMLDNVRIVLEHFVHDCDCFFVIVVAAATVVVVVDVVVILVIAVAVVVWPAGQPAGD